MDTDAPFDSIGKTNDPSSLVEIGPQSTPPFAFRADAFAVENTPKNSLAVPHVDPSASNTCPKKDPNELIGTPFALNGPPERALSKTVAAKPGGGGS